MPDAPTPNPSLADRLEEARALSMLCGATGTAISHADAKAAAVRLRKLDRIEAKVPELIAWAESYRMNHVAIALRALVADDPEVPDG